MRKGHVVVVKLTADASWGKWRGTRRLRRKGGFLRGLLLLLDGGSK